MATDMEKQIQANKRWREKNKEKAQYIRKRSSARTFIQKLLTIEDLQEFEQLITQRKKELQ